MEGQLSTEVDDHDGDGDDSGSSTRRRVLKASAALTATGIVGGSGFVGQAAASNRDGVDCSHSLQCEGTVVFRSQTVGSPDGTCGPDSVVIRSVVASCGTSWVDLHDKTRTVGPSGTYKAGYPVGASELIPKGTHTYMTIPLFDCPPRTCLEWDRCNWPSDTRPSGTREMGAMLHLQTGTPPSIDHYCEHEGPKTIPDPAYLCDRNNNGTRTPVETVRTVYGDGSQPC